MSTSSLDIAIEMALAAGDHLRREFNRIGGPRGIGSIAPADEEAEQLIVERLVSAFPEDIIQCEEGGRFGARGEGSGRVWLVDPNDGTRPFLHGVRGCSVSIGLVVDGLPVLGVVYAFNAPDDRGDLFAWEKGGPLMRNGKPVARKPWATELSKDCVVLLSQDADKNAAANLRMVAPMRYKAVTSIAYRMALVAVGEADLAVSISGPVSWDLAAGHALLLGAGGDLYDEHGKPLRYSPRGMTHASGRVFGGSAAIAAALWPKPWREVLHRDPPEPGYGLCEPEKGSSVFPPEILTRALGCMAGQVIGDSLGSLVEFQPAASIAAAHPAGLRDLADGGVWHTLAGQPTDDSELALILARALVARGQFDPDAILQAYRYWHRSGPFDCGATTSSGLRGQHNYKSMGNGALMRVSPLGIYGSGRTLAEVERAGAVDAALTHINPVCVEGCALYTMAIAHAIRSACSPQSLYQLIVERATARRVPKMLMDAIVAAEDSPPEDYLTNQGSTLIALRNALWQLLHAPSVEAAIVDTVMRGGDTDTNAAVCGALLGSVHGHRAFPSRWVNSVLSCRPDRTTGCRRPRPQCFWPVDFPILVERLLAAGWRNEAINTLKLVMPPQE